MQYAKLQPKVFPDSRPDETPETKFWSRMLRPVVTQHLAKITRLEFCPTAPYDFIMASSTKLQSFDSTTGEVKKTISRFKDVALCGSWRKDGMLIAASSADGIVSVHDVKSRTVLRRFEGHKGAVHLAKFQGMTSVWSHSDDKTVRLWDLPTQAQAAILTGHTDYVRCGAAYPGSPDCWLSGSFDHTVKLWDRRTEKQSLSVDHGEPIADIAVLGSLLFSAGNTDIKVWDLLSGRKLHQFSNHQKAITSLALDSTGSRLFSSSLDHQVKVYDVATYNVTHSFRHPGPVMSMAISPGNNSLVSGLVDGSLLFRRRANKEAVQQPFAPRAFPGTYRWFHRGEKYQPQADDLKVKRVKKQRLASYDLLLKKFRYREALDAALKTRSALVVVSLLDALVDRGALKQALAGRDDGALEPVLEFLVKHITNPHHSSILLDVTNHLLDLYSSVLGQSLLVDGLLMKLTRKVSLETNFQSSCVRLQGILHLLLSASTTTTPSESSSSSALDSSKPTSGLTIDSTEAEDAPPATTPLLTPKPQKSKKRKEVASATKESGVGGTEGLSAKKSSKKKSTKKKAKKSKTSK